MTTDLLPVRLGSMWIFVRAKTVSEFLLRTPWLSVPGSSPMLPGVMTWRGRAVPVLDLARALEVGVIAAQTECPRVMIIDHALGVIAVPVDGAREVRAVTDTDIHPPHVSNTPYTVGEVEAFDAVLPLIELDQILRDVGKAGA